MKILKDAHSWSSKGGTIEREQKTESLEYPPRQRQRGSLGIMQETGKIETWGKRGLRA